MHNCANLEGSYECSCLEGFVLEIDGRSCQVESKLLKFQKFCSHCVINIHYSQVLRK